MHSGHGLINYKDTETKCRLYWCLVEFIDWRYSQSCWYFRLSFVNYYPSNLISGSPPTPLPISQSQSTEYTQTVSSCEEVRWWVLSCVEDHILQEFNTLFLTRFRTYKALPPQTKTRRGGGLRQIKSRYRSILLDNDIWHRFLSV
jgi:hypothetical protein